MLTNLYYYGHYQSFISRIPSANRRRPIEGAQKAWQTLKPVPTMSDPAVLLNKAYKNKVVSYANTLSRGVTNMKDAAKMFVFDGQYANRNFDIVGLEPNWHWLEEDIDNFVNAYNGIQDLSLSTNHSPAFIQFSFQMRNYIRENENILQLIGVANQDSFRLTFENRESPEITPHDIDAAMDFFKGTYSRVDSFLSAPLAHHMEFRGLSYYYNYKIGDIQENTFAIIERGLIIDMAV